MCLWHKDLNPTSIINFNLRCIHYVAGECELIDHKFKDGRVSPFSLPRCRNVYVLPGVPDLLRQKWRTLKVLFCCVWRQRA
jgi:hypothetical protein